MQPLNVVIISWPAAMVYGYARISAANPETGMRKVDDHLVVIISYLQKKGKKVWKTEISIDSRVV